MNEFLTVLLFAAMPAAGNLFGGALAEIFTVSSKTLSLSLHFAAGIVLAVVGIELMPSALAVEQAWIPLCAFVTGGLAFILMDKLMDLIKERFSGSDSTTGSAWGIYFGVAIDLFSDGIMIGSGSTVAISLGLLLALGQIPADIPEGFATIATFKRKGVSKKLRYFLAIGFVVPIFLGATIGYWAVRDSPEIVQLSLLAFTAGILVTVAIEEMITEAHEKPDSTYASFFLTAGFALFAFIAVYMEG